MTHFKLNPETDFTPSQLRDWLNKNFTTKESGKPFTNSDVYMYTKRGHLPDFYTGAKITVIENKSIGIKILRLITKKK